MPRKGNTPKREVLPDPVYGNIVVSKLINSIMLDGKKSTAQKIVYGAFDQIKAQTGEDPLDVFNKAMENIMPQLEVKARRVGGANYQVPVEVRPARRQTLGALRASPTPGKITLSALTISSGLSVTTASYPNRRKAHSTEKLFPALYFIIAIFITLHKN